jgi:hypothetical protein
MNKEDFQIDTILIRKEFSEERPLRQLPQELEKKLDPKITETGSIFIADDGELVYFTLQLTDFGEKELVEYTEIAEKLYELNHKQVHLNILCSNDIDVHMKVCEIVSDADFKIKICKSEYNPAEHILDMIKSKMRDKKRISSEDLHVLARLPMICEKKDRNYYRLEYFKIVNQLH